MGSIQSRRRKSPRQTEAEFLQEMQLMMDALATREENHIDNLHPHPPPLWTDANTEFHKETLEETTEIHMKQNRSTDVPGVHRHENKGFDFGSNESSIVGGQKDKRVYSYAGVHQQFQTPLMINCKVCSERSDANNCADIEVDSGNSRCPNNEDTDCRTMSNTHLNRAGKIGTLFKETATKAGNKKRRKGFVYLSPRIERKRPDIYELEDSASPLENENTDFMDILTESEMTAAGHSSKPLTCKSGITTKLSSANPAAMQYDKNLSEERERTALTLGALGSAVTQETTSLALGAESKREKNRARNTDCTLEIDEEPRVEPFLSYDGQGSFTSDRDVSPTRSLVLPDWKRVQQILDDLRNCVGDDDVLLGGSKGSGLDRLAGSGDSCLAANLSCIERELATLVALDNETNAMCLSPSTSGLNWNTNRRKTGRNRRGRNKRRGREDNEKPLSVICAGDNKECAHGDIPMQEFRTTVASGQCCPGPQDLRGLHVGCAASLWNGAGSNMALKDYKLRRPTSSNRPLENVQQDMAQFPEDCDHNTNESTSLGTSAMSSGHAKRLPVYFPARQHKRRRCMSAPELRYLPDRLGPLRRVSLCDVPVSHRSDFAGPDIVYMNSSSDHLSFPTFLRGENAYRHYKLLTMIETKEKIQTIKSVKAAIINKYMYKQRVLQNMVNVAKAYYSDPTCDKRTEWKRLRDDIKQSKDYSITDLRHNLAQMPSFAPIFTIILMVAHMVSLVVLCSVEGLAPSGVLSQKEVRREIQTFLGAETVHRYIIPNPWLGPPAAVMIAAGASFAPCLRRDRYVETQGGKAMKFQPMDNTSFACCRMRGPINAAGTTTRKECSNFTNNAGAWEHPRCSQRVLGSTMNKAPHIIRPCCTDHRGICRMLSQEHCSFLGGTFHENEEHCVQVLCLRDFCTLGTNLFLIDPDPDKPWLAEKGTVWQWWRPLMAQMYTFGILHCLPLLILEWLLMRPLEKSSGWFPILMTYTISGVTGQFAAGLADPTIPQVGSTSGMAGMVGEAVVELSQAWKMLEKPLVEAFKLLCFMLILLLMGLFPYVSVFGCVAGFCCGAVCTLIFMPYMTVDWWGWCHKLMLMAVGLAVLVITFCTVLYVYVEIQPKPCLACRALDCLSLMDSMCNQWDLLG